MQATAVKKGAQFTTKPRQMGAQPGHALLRARQAMIIQTMVTPANFDASAVSTTGAVRASIMPKKIKVSSGMLSAELIHNRSRNGRLVMLNTSQSMHDLAPEKRIPCQVPQ